MRLWQAYEVLLGAGLSQPNKEHPFGSARGRPKVMEAAGADDWMDGAGMLRARPQIARLRCHLGITRTYLQVPEPEKTISSGLMFADEAETRDVRCNLELGRRKST